MCNARPPAAERSSDHGINSAQATPSSLSLQPSALGSDVFAWHGRRSSDAVAIGAISRSLAGSYARYQGPPRCKQSLCLQSGRGPRIVAQPRRISLVLHIGRESLDKLARTTRGAHRSRPGQALPRYRTAERILRLVQAELPREERGSPAEGTSERRAPIRLAAWARVAEFAARTASPLLDASLRLAAQQHHEFRSLAGLRTHPLVRDDQEDRGAIGRRCDPIPSCRKSRCGRAQPLPPSRAAAGTGSTSRPLLPARPVLRFNRATRRMSAAQ